MFHVSKQKLNGQSVKEMTKMSNSEVVVVVKLKKMLDILRFLIYFKTSWANFRSCCCSKKNTKYMYS